MRWLLPRDIATRSAIDGRWQECKPALGRRAQRGPVVHSLAIAVFALVMVSMSLVAFVPAGRTASACTIMGTKERERIVGTRRDDIICSNGSRDRILGRAAMADPRA